MGESDQRKTASWLEDGVEVMEGREERSERVTGEMKLFVRMPNQNTFEIVVRAVIWSLLRWQWSILMVDSKT